MGSKDTPFVILVLQGGGARGAYQIGVRRALAEAGLEPNWVCGISSGALNAAVVATNEPGDRDAALLSMWRAIGPVVPPPTGLPEPLQTRVRSLSSLANLSGQRGFFARRPGLPALHPPGSPGATSLFSNAPLVRTLNRFCPFDAYNARPVGERTRLSLGATDVEAGRLVFFDSMATDLTAEHVTASGSLPPGSAAVPLGGRLYWDGGVAANSPLNHVLEVLESDLSLRGRPILVINVDLWSAEGSAPQDLASAYWRQQQIQFSSRSYMALERFQRDLERMALQALVDAGGGLVSGTPNDYLPSVTVLHLEHGRSFDLLPLGPLDFSPQAVDRRIRQGADETAEVLRISDWAACLEAGGVVVKLFREGSRLGRERNLVPVAAAIASSLAAAQIAVDRARDIVDAAAPPPPPLTPEQVTGRYVVDHGEGTFPVDVGAPLSEAWMFRVSSPGPGPVDLPGAPGHTGAARLVLLLPARPSRPRRDPPRLVDPRRRGRRRLLRPSRRGLRMRRTLLLSALLVGCAAPDGLRETPDGTGPMVLVDWDAEPLPELPFPNDLATRVDRTSPTGLRVNFSLASPTETETEARAKVNEGTGFGVFAPITVRFTARLDLDAIVARHADDGVFLDDAFFVIDVTEGSPTYGRPVDLDVGHGRYPGDLVSTDAYFPNDPRAQSPSLLFETYDEDVNGNGRLDGREDTDWDGVLDRPNVYPLDSTNPREDLMTWYELETDTLIVRPIMPLREETTYAVVLTERLTDADGNPVRSPWEYVHHTRQTEALEALVPTLFDLGLSVEDIGFAWTFTTAAVTRDLRDIRKGLYGDGPYAFLADEYPPGVHAVERMQDPLIETQSPFRVTKSRLFGTLLNLGLFGDGPEADVLDEGFEFIDFVAGGRYMSPQLLVDRNGDGDTSDEWWDLDASSEHMLREPGEMTFTCVIPKADEQHQQPFPVAIYGHGYRSSRFEGLAFTGAIARHGVATCLMDAPGHGPTLDADDQEEILPVLEEFGLLPFLEHLESARDRDLDNDGDQDSGADMWTSDPFHTRDMVRQMVVDWFQLVRPRRGGGRGSMGTDIDGDGREETTCDWDADGVPDLGGPDASISLMGGSLGGINSAVAAPLEPEFTGVIPVVPGAGLLDVGWRSDLNGVRQAAVGRVMSPLFLGRPAEDGSLAVTQMVTSTTRMAELHVATLSEEEVSRAVAVRVTNPANGEVRQHGIPTGGTFRIGIPADAMSALQKRMATAMPDTGPALGATYELPDNEGLGDPLEVEILDAAGGVIRTITTWEQDVTHEGVTMRAGSPLIAASEGLGRLRGSPQLRRLVDVLRMVLEPGDPACYAPAYHREPFEEVGRPTNVFVMPTPGDTVVNVATGITLARIAGMYDYRAHDARYGMTVDRWLIERQVVRGLEEFGPWTDANGDPALFDADDLDDGTDGLGVPSDAPLRATITTESGTSGLRLPYVNPRGSHGFGLPTLDTGFDTDTYALAQAAWWLATDGAEFLDDPCFATRDCDFYRPLPESNR